MLTNSFKLCGGKTMTNNVALISLLTYPPKQILRNTGQYQSMPESLNLVLDL